jgi:hypothetical protein
MSNSSPTREMARGEDGALGKRHGLRKFVAIVGLGALVATLSGCGTPASTGASNTTTSTPSTTVNTTPPPSAAAAILEWERGATVPSYQQSAYLRKAAADIERLLHDGIPNPSNFQTAERELLQLALIPETSASSAQRAEATHDVRALNTFFGTTGLYQ